MRTSTEKPKLQAENKPAADPLRAAMTALWQKIQNQDPRPIEQFEQAEARRREDQKLQALLARGIPAIPAQIIAAGRLQQTTFVKRCAALPQTALICALAGDLGSGRTTAGCALMAAKNGFYALWEDALFGRAPMAAAGALCLDNMLPAHPKDPALLAAIEARADRGQFTALICEPDDVGRLGNVGKRIAACGGLIAARRVGDK